MIDDLHGLHEELPGTSFGEAIDRVTEALKVEGFGIFNRMEIEETPDQGADVESRRSIVLGVCNPKLAPRVHGRDHSLGELLPCRVVVAETTEGAEVRILQLDTSAVHTDQYDSGSLDEELKTRLHRVLNSL